VFVAVVACVCVCELAENEYAFSLFLLQNSETETEKVFAAPRTFPPRSLRCSRASPMRHVEAGGKVFFTILFCSQL
jgi:hypothetical protein